MSIVRFNGQEVKLTTACPWSVKNGVLWNDNTSRDEGVEGDSVDYKIGDTRYRGHVVGYTCCQCITTQEFGSVVIPANDLKYVHFTHQTKVEMVKDY